MRQVHQQSQASATATTTAKTPVPPPLVVDLDGTLLRTDLLHESALRLLKQKPWAILLLPLWLIRGRAYLKHRIFQLVQPDCDLLPVHEELLDWLRAEKATGRLMVLATASDQRLAELVVDRFEIFNIILGSDLHRNLKGSKKLQVVTKICGYEFDYAGNSRADHALWRASREAIVVNAPKSVESAARRDARVTRVFDPPPNRLKSAVRSMRLYQWVKNLLIFLPAFTSHTGTNWPVLTRCAIAFLAFSVCASGVYVMNDLLDLDEDRRHGRKRKRPFASGQCPISTGVLLAAVCLMTGLTLAVSVGGPLLPLLLLYVGLTSWYSLHLKRLLLVDVLILALLYTLRLVVGHAVTGIPSSVWLSSFAFFLFLSLAFAKRAAELVKANRAGAEMVPGRGYAAVDLQIITTAGVSSGFLSSLVLALYINSSAVGLLYHRPEVLWAIVPLLLYYIARLWVICGRGELDDDPIIYTAKSSSTYWLAVMVLLIVAAATTRSF
jgi:4-hydroxybenzoate polyprenyltransferase